MTATMRDALKPETTIEWSYPGILQPDGMWTTGPVWIKVGVAVPVPTYEADSDGLGSFQVGASANLVGAISAAVALRHEIEELEPHTDATLLRAKCEKIAQKHIGRFARTK